MNWGKGIAAVLIAFAAMMAWFLVKAAQSPTPLVSEDYYAQELAYQDRINDTQRAEDLEQRVNMKVAGDGLKLTFPTAMRGHAITGHIKLMCPNDPERDREVSLHADSTGTFIASGMGLTTGRYNALVEWTAGNVSYYSEEKLYVP